MGCVTNPSLLPVGAKLSLALGAALGEASVKQGRIFMPSLFDPMELGALHLPNRIVMGPMTRARAGREGVPNALMAD
jgi:hypothetical protein